MHPPFGVAPGLAASQATHLVASGLFCSMQVSHSQLPDGAANLANRPSLLPADDPDPAADPDPAEHRTCQLTTLSQTVLQ